MNLPRASFVSTCLVAVALVTAGCGSPSASPGPDASPSPAASPGGAGTAVEVTLQEWAVLPATQSAPGGAVTFNVTNTGPEDTHEFVVVRTDLPASELPTDANGVVDEAAGGMEVIDEIEDIAVGDAEQLTVDLDPGNYALICNIYDTAEAEAHYSFGMFAAFSVTE